MPSGSADISSILDRILDAATDNLRIAKILVQMGLDPNNVTYDAIFNRLLEIFVQNITLANMFAAVGAGFFVATLLMRTMVPLRVANMVGCAFFAVFGALSANVSTFLLYLLLLPINALRLRQMLKLVKKARHAAEGDMSIEWLKPFMTERKYRRGDTLFKLGDPAKEMLLTVTGKFLVKEINVEIGPGALMGELGFLTPDNRRTGTIECVEDGQVLTITYDRLLEIYFQDPQFGYYFLVLTSQRLLQNIDRLQKQLASGAGTDHEPDRVIDCARRSAQQQRHARIALLHRAPVGRARTDAAEIFDHIRTAREVIGLEVAHRGEREAHHDVGGGEGAARQIFGVAKPRIDQIEGAIEYALCSRASIGLSSASLSRFRIISRPMPACSVPLAK